MAQKKSSTSKKLKSSKLRFFKTSRGLAAILVVLTFAGIGGYKVIASHAQGYTAVNTSHNVKVYACKTYIPAYGGIYQVKYLFIKPAGSTYGPHYWIAGPRSSSTGSHSYWGGTTGSATINVSTFYKETINAFIDNWSTGLKNPANFTNC